MIPGAPELLENDLNSPFLGKGRGLLGWKWEEGTGINVTSFIPGPAKGAGAQHPAGGASVENLWPPAVCWVCSLLSTDWQQDQDERKGP